MKKTLIYNAPELVTSAGAAQSGKHGRHRAD